MTEYEKDGIRNQLPQVLEPAPNRGFYICPLCGSGTGPNATGAVKLQKDGIHAHCHACNETFDLIDIVSRQYGLDPAGAFQKAQELYGSAPPAPLNTQKKQERQKPRTDYTGYIEKCQKDLQESPEALAYLHGRGFNDETITRFMLGYDRDKKQIVIPYSRAGRYFIRRSIGEPRIFYKPPHEQAGPEPIYNESALWSNDAVFVVESQLCAISIEQCGGHAVAVGGTGTNRLIERLQAKPSGAMLILSFDGDSKGAEAQQKLMKQLQEIGRSFCIDIEGGYKDPNEALQRNPDALKERIRNAEAEAIQKREQETTAERDAYYKLSAAAHIDDFLDGVRESANTPAVPTGFDKLDAVLDGGIFPALHIIGAISSLGKTTLTLQIADQMAQQGHEVLIFSLEMSRAELMAKAISRITFEKCAGQTNNAKTTHGIMQGSRYAHYSPAEMELIQEAVTAYSTFADNIYIEESIGNTGTAQMRERIQQHIRVTGNRPVVVLDYLQALAPADPRASEKQAVDRNVSELKRITRDYKLPVIAISSLNRASYGSRISMSAFKESGSIEYGADVLLGLQFRKEVTGDNASEEKIDELKNARTRQVEIKVLKSRNGPTGSVVPFEYISMFNYFKELERR